MSCLAYSKFVRTKCVLLKNLDYTTIMRNKRISIMPAKDARVDIKTTKDAKATLEQAAYVLGTTLSAFMLDCAMPKAREIIKEANLINLTRDESERFIAALQNPPKANEKLKQLFRKHSIRQHQHNEKI